MAAPRAGHALRFGAAFAGPHRPLCPVNTDRPATFGRRTATSRKNIDYVLRHIDRAAIKRKLPKWVIEALKTGQHPDLVAAYSNLIEGLKKDDRRAIFQRNSTVPSKGEGAGGTTGGTGTRFQEQRQKQQQQQQQRRQHVVSPTTSSRKHRTSPSEKVPTPPPPTNPPTSTSNWATVAAAAAAAARAARAARAAGAKGTRAYSTKASTASRAPRSSSPTRRTASEHLSAIWSPLSSRFRASNPFLVPLLAGLLLGTWVTTYVHSAYLVSPPRPSTDNKNNENDGKGGPRDAEVESIQRALDENFLVKVYRGKCVGAGRVIRGASEGSGWREISTDDGGGGGGGGGRAGGRYGEVRAAEIRFEAEKRRNWARVVERERELGGGGGGGGGAGGAGPGAPDAGGGEGGAVVNLGNKGSREERLEGLRQQAEALGLDLDLPADSKGEREAEEEEEEEEGEGWRGGDAWARRTGFTGDGVLAWSSWGLAGERVFWNDREGELVAVLWLGRGLCGWPGMVHGGALATVLQEKLATAAELSRRDLFFAAGAGGGGSIMGPTEGRGNDWRTALGGLEVEYRKPTVAGKLYVVRAVRKLDAEGDVMRLEGRLETLDGTLCVQAHGQVAVREPVPGANSRDAGWRKWASWLGSTVGLKLGSTRW